jgi:hypothetical protein
MNAELGLREDQLVAVREFITTMRARMPIAMIDAYYDDQGRALCPMATGISHHIGPGGHIEPCPILQFATETIRDPRGAVAAIRDSAFLRDFRQRTAETTRGCVVLERPDLVEELVRTHRAHDTTQRGTALRELQAMQSRFSQWLPGREIPEKHWMYRWAKKYWFSDFGAYRSLRHHAPLAAGPSRPPTPATPPQPATSL